MMKHYQLLLVAALMGVAACNSEEESMPMPDAALEIKGIRAAIGADEVRVQTRANEAAAKQLQIGRTGFVDKDAIVFTTIKRTNSPLDSFTYSNIHYQYAGAKWERIANGTANDPEKIYWTDASSDHTFIGYSLPQGYQWTTVTNTAGNSTYDTYAGELGYGKGAIVYSSSEELEKEDLLILHSDTTKADPGGLTTTVYFTHALSSVQVVVNIKNFAASASAVDTVVKVSHMVLHSQPCKYTWGATSKVDVTARDFGADQTTKDITLWCPKPDGEGKAQSKTFTFYGITTPQNATFHEIPGNKQPLKFSFEVEYPDAMNPGQTVKKNYSGAFSSLVDFKPGMQTTLNISLNHKDEQMFTGVTYTDWNFVETPDLGKLRKKSTFMDMTAQEENNVKVHTEVKTADDATWLYQDGNDVVKDIYGHDGTSAQKAYVIKSAQQLLALAKEVNSDYTFKGKFIRLEADITMQKSAKDSTYIWNGIGDDSHAFNGTFLGGDRYINRLQGKPLFAHLGEHAHVEQLQITSIGGITGGGALAGTNKGVIAACRVIDDVESTGGALVGTNRGTIYACYYTGTNGYKLIGAGSEGSQSIGCYEAKTIQSMSFSEIQAQVDGWNKALEAWYEGKSYTKYVYEYQPGSYPTVKPK